MTKKYTYPLGIIIIVIGSLLLFQNIGLRIGAINIAWNGIAKLLLPIVLILIGIKRIKTGRGFMTSYFLVILGIFFTLRNITTLHPALNALRNYSWSLFIIITGLVLILRPSPNQQEEEDFITTKGGDDTPYANSYTYSDASANNFKHSDPYFYDQSASFFEDFDREQDDTTTGERVPASERSYQASLRSSAIVLNKSDFKPGLNIINLHCSMAEINLKLPKSVNITLLSESAFGEIVFDQKKHSGLRRINKIEHKPAQYSDIDIQINAIVKFGEISVDLQ